MKNPRMCVWKRARQLSCRECNDEPIAYLNNIGHAVCYSEVPTAVWVVCHFPRNRGSGFRGHWQPILGMPCEPECGVGHASTLKGNAV